MPYTKEQMAVYMLRRYHRRRALAIKQLGGKCLRCSSTINLEIDHKRSSKKKISLGGILTSGNEELVQKELKKCQLLCKRCHKKKSSRQSSRRMKLVINKLCGCGKIFKLFSQYVGHRAWCKMCP